MALGVSDMERPLDRPKGLTRLEGASLVCGTGLVMVLADVADGTAVYADVDDRLFETADERKRTVVTTAAPSQTASICVKSPAM